MDQEFAQVGFALSVITVVILLLILLVVNLMLTGRNRKLKHQSEMLQVQSKLKEELASIRMEVAEATLSDVSRDLHDEVGQLLTFCVLQLQNLSVAKNENKTMMLDEVKQSVRDALDSIRSISRGLNPDFVNQQGLALSLEQLIDRATLRTGKKFTLTTDDGFVITNPSNSVIVFRIVRECLTNAVRHAQAHQVAISLKNVNGNAIITIHDDGIGMNSTGNSIGLGFKTMQHYAGLMHGQLTTESSHGDGTKIILTFPNQST